jgi:WD40 repeat protein
VKQDANSDHHQKQEPCIMRGLSRAGIAAILLVLSGVVAGAALAESRDRLGDPLPQGAIARLGSARLRMGGEARALTFSQDGKLLATVDSTGTLRVWSIASGKELVCQAGQNPHAAGLAFSADGKALVSASDKATLDIYDISSLSEKGEKPAALNKQRLTIAYRGNLVAFLAFSPDGKTLLSGESDGQVRLWDTGNGRQLRTLGTVAKALHCYALSPDGKTLAVAPHGEAPALWDVTTGKMLGRMPGREVVLSLAFSSDGKYLAAGIDNSDAIRLWDVASRKEVRSFVGRKEAPLSSRFGTIARGIGFTSDGKTLVSLGGLEDDKVRVWDVESGKEKRVIRGNRGDGGMLALSPDGRVAAVAGHNAVVRLWDPATGKELHGDLGRQAKVQAVAVSPDNKHVAVGSFDGVVRLYERATGMEVRSWPAEPHSIGDVTFTPDGKSLLVSIAYHPAKLWDLASGKEIRTFAGATGSVRGVFRAAFSPDGARLALAVPEPSFQIVDPANGKVLRRLGEKLLVDRMAFSPDGGKLAGGGFDRAVHLWDVASGKEIWVARNTNAISAVAFAPDGDTVLMGDYGAGIHLLSAATGEVVRSIQGMIGIVRAAAFSPDGRLIAASGDSNDVLLLETASGTEVGRLSGHKAAVWTLAFSPDGRSLVSGSFDATALLWDISGRAFVKKAAAALSDAERERLWADLGAADGREGYRAVWTLLQSGKQGVAFLESRLRSGPDAKTIDRLIAQLDDDQFAVRQKASAALAKMGPPVEAPLKAALEKAPSAEAKRRIEEILHKLGDTGDARLRALRLVAVLEHVGVPEGRALLERLADKNPSPEMQRAARAALKRLKNRLERSSR